ncbi:TrbI/VirB10 family protein [Roseicella aquatilis]|uniref:TrbI/VirB10 family protein n=1 Tax=Roseicella aquatilis TaxID=2527868 RepID=A0A4R4DIP8_9PROT|nr:TrbI/VirB10 family protein [Roseicella aquatilis]TCZ61136.1 TrbI/VirB10 family protein [Roseicella aquatilis]
MAPPGDVPSPVAGGTTAVAGRKPWSLGRKLGFGAMVAGSIAGLVWLTRAPHEDTAARRATPANGARVGEIGEGWTPVRPPPPSPPPPPPPPAQQAAARVPSDPFVPPPPAATAAAAGGVQRVRIDAFQAGSGGARGGAGANAPAEGGGAAAGAGSGDELDQRLTRGADQGTAVARLLPDRDRFITMGTPMGCLPEGPINTDTPGAFRCRVTQPVFSTSGNVVLLDPGTWMVGTIGESMRRGARRAFGVVRRIETPQGCIVALRAPLADNLGEAGLEGEVDRHFFERFRGLALMALLDAAGQAAALAAANALAGDRSRGGISFYQFQGMGRQLGQGFADDTHIPPTLRRNQALPILVMAMQDIDMRGCYRLRRTEAAR